MNPHVVQSICMLDGTQMGTGAKVIQESKFKKFLKALDQKLVNF